MVFLTKQYMGGTWCRRGSGFGWWQVVLVVDGARDGARAKDGAVARGMIFDSNSSLACNKALFISSSLSPKCPIK